MVSHQLVVDYVTLKFLQDIFCRFSEPIIYCRRRRRAAAPSENKTAMSPFESFSDHLNPYF